jgi:rSAM/selenodomain-associated transferase 2
MSSAVESASHVVTKSQALESLAIVIPVYRDFDALKLLLKQLNEACRSGAELIVVGTHDDTQRADVESAAHRANARYIASQRGRGAQLAAGALAVSANRTMLWFLHADSVLPDDAAALVCNALSHHPWGRFDVKFDHASFMLNVVAATMNFRSAVTGIATGDQGMFVRRDLYQSVGGFLSLPLMEDIALSRVLCRSTAGGKPARIRVPITTYARKWQREGTFRTIMRMAWWRFRFWWGVRPEILAQEYYRDLA